MELTQEYLKSQLRYEPETGLFFWIAVKRGRVLNKPAGRISKGHGYCEIGIDYQLHRAHRLAFLYMTGKMPIEEVDHIDLNKSNNKWQNLRLASKSQNALNVIHESSSGYTGVHWDKSRNKWHAQIRIEGKKKNLGRYDNIEDAKNAWLSVAINHNFNYRPSIELT